VARSDRETAAYSAVKVNNVLDGPFASRVKDHFAYLLNFSPDVSAATDELGTWWRDGYLLRNAVAHRAHRATG
jgi:hypothetical protein